MEDILSELTEYKNMLDLLPCGICKIALDDELTLLYANQFYYQIYGYTIQNAEKQGFTNAKFVLPESDYQTILNAVNQHIEQGDRNFQLEFRSVHSTGKLMWMLVRCAYFPEYPGSILCALVDIEERKCMEEELRIIMKESQNTYQLKKKSMYIFDVAERKLHQPKIEADEFGLPAVAENVPYSIAESGVINEMSRDDYINFYESIIGGDPTGHAVIKKQKKDGSFGWYEVKFFSIYDNDKNPKRAIISCENITE